jgi:hypothetical protein
MIEAIAWLRYGMNVWYEAVLLLTATLVAYGFLAGLAKAVWKAGGEP